jgi:outer membrane murein-binding lipoprotein Lpp
MNDIRRMIKESEARSQNKWELKKLQNDIRNLNSKISRLEKKIENA